MSPIVVSILWMLARRLLEPSTWAGIAGLAATLGFDPTPLHGAGEVVLAIGSALAVVIPEGLAARLGVKPRGSTAAPGPGA